MNETITQKNYQKLTLLVGTGRLSFCCTNVLDNSISNLTSATFPANIPTEDALWKTFVEHPELKMPYDNIMVLHENSFNTFVPDALFDENYAASYLQYNTQVFETDSFEFDNIGHQHIKNVYVPLVNINNYLLEKIGSFEFKNSNTVLVSKLLEAARNNIGKQVYIHIQDVHFEIVVTDNQKLLFYNSFTYNTPEDFLYYLLFTLEQLELNPETVSIKLLGKIDEDSPLFKIGYEYIRNIALYTQTTTNGLTEHQTREHFILINA
ncbi:DUF3822 family protein [Flavobacterium rhizosphaerae]|uniref:DUF3822 family protein n=1 Tax=Flavobacterium rhizosphaerae TaxID=3163298 RepID=A0ABW8YW04_9FLAO